MNTLRLPALLGCAVLGAAGFRTNVGFVNLAATPSPVALFSTTNITADVTDNYHKALEQMGKHKDEVSALKPFNQTDFVQRIARDKI